MNSVRGCEGGHSTVMSDQFAPDIVKKQDFSLPRRLGSRVSYEIIGVPLLVHAFDMRLQHFERARLQCDPAHRGGSPAMIDGNCEEGRYDIKAQNSASQ